MSIFSGDHYKTPNPSSVTVDLPLEAINQITERNKGTIILPRDGPMPNGQVVSRFLAKVALEAMALRLVDYPEGIDYLAQEEQLDLIRNHARRGEIKKWPYSSRRIYDPDEKWLDEKGELVQMVHEHDILLTDAGEYYFVLSLFGMEYVINYGGPEIEGYDIWLKEHNNVSPLFWGKNAWDPSLKLIK